MLIAEANIDAKVVVIREGSSSRTSEELLEVFVEDACDLLDVNPQVDSFNEEDRFEALESARSEYENQLANAGYTVVWDDGFVIYKDLGMRELNYIREF
jgi:hypothetical protein